MVLVFGLYPFVVKNGNANEIKKEIKLHILLSCETDEHDFCIYFIMDTDKPTTKFFES